MVRLKEDFPGSANDLPSSFNSTMVRLKASSSKIFLYLLDLFQFHYGSIKGRAKIPKENFIFNDLPRKSSQL